MELEIGSYVVLLFEYIYHDVGWAGWRGGRVDGGQVDLTGDNVTGLDCRTKKVG